MKLSTRGRYGARLMLDLALHYGEGNIFLKDIAARQNISEKYLWHLVPPLRNAGLLQSTRGARGGYTLARPPSKITMEEIVTIVEGNILIEDEPGYPWDADGVTGDLWREVKEAILKTLESYTLEDLVEKEKQKSLVGTYAI